jgi:Zn finger protein HypA/HybF involved in hydrogenase expression
VKWTYCPECDKYFPKHGNQIYCSNSCRLKQKHIREGKELNLCQKETEATK